MRIKPDDLFPDPLDFHQALAPGTVQYAMDLEQVGPIDVEGRAERIEEHRGPKDVVFDIRVRGKLQGDFRALCARCTTPVPQHVSERFDLIFRPAGADADLGERAITEAETEIGYYEPGGLSLEDVVREQVLLSLPERMLCQQDCKGLCPHCGENRNEHDCDCGSKQADPRWSALQGFSAN